jgi:AraC-like DNA-binding protein
LDLVKTGRLIRSFSQAEQLDHFAAHWDRMPPVNVASAMVEGAGLRLRRPVPCLRAYLGCFWSIETTPATRLRTLPDASATLAIESGRGKSVECFLVGPRQTPAARVPASGQILFGVRLKPGVAFVFTGIPVHTLVERRIRLAARLPEVGSRLEKLLAGTQTVEESLDALERFLIQRLSGVQIDSRVQMALKRMEECSGQMRIGQLARDCQVSLRHLDRLLRDWVGFSPKRLARIMRFQALLQHLETSPSDCSARVAAELGYFDQAHLANEVRLFAGTSPGRIARHGVADFSKTRCE